MEQDGTVAEPSSHIVNMGRLVEDMENKIRHTLNEIYFGKTKDIVNGLRSIQPLPDQKQQQMVLNDLANALQKRQVKSDWLIVVGQRNLFSLLWLFHEMAPDSSRTTPPS